MDELEMKTVTINQLDPIPETCILGSNKITNKTITDNANLDNQYKIFRNQEFADLSGMNFGLYNKMNLFEIYYTLEAKQNSLVYKGFDYLDDTEKETGVISYGTKKTINIKFTSQDPQFISQLTLIQANDVYNPPNLKNKFEYLAMKYEILHEYVYNFKLSLGSKQMKSNPNDFSDISKYTEDSSCSADLVSDPQKYFNDTIQVQYSCQLDSFKIVSHTLEVQNDHIYLSEYLLSFKFNLKYLVTLDTSTRCEVNIIYAGSSHQFQI